jgi:putative two-component system response regulator
MGIVDLGFSATPPSVRPAARHRRTLARRVRDSVESFLASGDLSYERNFLMVRPAIAALVIAAALLSNGLPGTTGLVIGCSTAIAYNFLLAALLFSRHRYIMRVTSLVFDNLTVICTSLWVFAQMGNAGYESDLWLVFMTLIVTNALYYGPIGSLLFTSLYVGILMGTTFGFYDEASYSRDQLPVRLTFFVLTGFTSISLSAELRRRRKKLEHQSRQTLSMLAQIVEARDTDAGAHLKHITHYSRALALHMGLSDHMANEISYAAMIHDVGKAQVPDSILKKPGPLTPAERREIEKHTVWGHELLADNDEFTAAAQVARWHHERWDGSGYPDGLAGDAIPLSARIAAVADVYDALVSERPYKRAWAPKDAIDEIQRLRGGHLDPTVVDAFLELWESGALRAIDRTMRDDDALPHAA